MITIRPVSRFKAASVHLLISAAVALLTLFSMLAVWYPPPLFTAMGGAELALLIIAIDVTIGPIITLIVFNHQKKGMLFDLVVIALLQLSALAYGVHAMYSARPAYIVAYDGVLIVVPATELEPEDLAKAQRDEFRSLPLGRPRLVAATLPEDPNDRSTLSLMAAFGVVPPKHYVPYAEGRQQMLEASRPLADLDLKPEEQARLDKFVRDSGQKEGDLRCLPVNTRAQPVTAILDAQGEVIGMVDVPPNVKKR